jgi:hypothetical protein
MVTCQGWVHENSTPPRLPSLCNLTHSADRARWSIAIPASGVRWPLTELPCRAVLLLLQVLFSSGPGSSKQMEAAPAFPGWRTVRAVPLVHPARLEPSHLRAFQDRAKKQVFPFAV